MRILKFRAYRPDSNRFDYFSLNNITVPDRYLSQENYPVQQFTGFSDINKVDIFEGDILKYYLYNYNTFITSVVEWRDGGWSLVQYKPTLTAYTPFIFNNTMEVIGNIIENPELIAK